MRVVQLDFEDPSFPARLVEHDDPPLPGPEWARVAVTGGGICGSDLHIFKPTTGPTPALMAYGSLPLEMGHEIAGTVIEAGPGCPVPEGARVAIDPVIACAARGIDPLCDRCQAGAASVCRHIGSRILTPGMGTGFTSGLGGGWGDTVLAHHTQLHAVPDAVEPRAETLHEPLSVSVHGMLRVPPSGGPVLVVGAGIIGLLATAAVRSLFPELEVVVLAKHPHQAAAARACGASHVVELGSVETGGVEIGSDVYGRLAEIAGTEVKGTGDDAMLAGGFPYVIEAVGGEASVTQALRCVDSRGDVLLLGAAGVSTVDLTPIWFKEAALAGSFCHAHDPGPGAAGAVHSIDQALAILASGAVPAQTVVTHEFPLEEWRDGLETAMAREAGAIKVVLRPSA